MTNNTYYDENNHIVYKVHTPFGFSNQTTTITKTRDTNREYGKHHVVDRDSSSRRGGNTVITTPGGLGIERGRFGVEPQHNLVEIDTDSSGFRRRNSDTGNLNAGSNFNIDGKGVIGWPGAEDADTAEEACAAGTQASGSSLGARPHLRAFEYIAQIDWKLQSADTRFRLGDGGEIKEGTLFRKEGRGRLGR
ncbi:hypothetical protein L218DRAFT_956917 [Marasmius fiardii PR-910]|nr:hypothetical protein L218DRAFT_956917 [Marasmius fiardii PR-910]